MRFSPDSRGILLGWAGCGHLTEGSLAEQECHQSIGAALPGRGDTSSWRDQLQKKVGQHPPTYL